MWIQTDDYQFIKKVDENNYEALESFKFKGKFHLYHMNININNYDLNKEIEGYYNSLEEVKALYGSDWKQVVIEVIARNNATDGDIMVFDTFGELNSYLNNNYTIQWIDYSV